MASPYGPPMVSAPPQPMDPSQESRETKTLWVGDIDHWMDENYLSHLFAHTGEVVNVKIIRDKVTGYPAGYGFVEFSSRYSAQRVLETYNGREITGTGRCYRLNWASFGINEKRPPVAGPTGRSDSSPEYSIFVGDLAADVTDYTLQSAFASRYPSVKSAKVVTDPQSNTSRGYGFVRFSNEDDMKRAMAEMNGVYIGSRPIRISNATPKKQGVGGATTSTAAPSHQSYPSEERRSQSSAPLDANDPNNTTIFVGGLDGSVVEDDLRQAFAAYGELVYVKIPFGKGCGFVQYCNRQAAESALHHMHGAVIGPSRIRCSWGRSPQGKASSSSSSRPSASAPPPSSTSYPMMAPPAAAPTYDAYYSHHHVAVDPYAGYYAPYPDPYAYGAAAPPAAEPAAAYDHSYHAAATTAPPAAVHEPPVQQTQAAPPTRAQTHKHDHKEEEDFTKAVDVKAENDGYVDEHLAQLDCRFLSLAHIKPIDRDPLDVK